jgi:hypothetical protein
MRVALVDQDSMQPRFEPIVVAERAQLAPGLYQRSLNSILGEVAIAQDPVRDRQASVADSAHQGIEGLSITLFCPVDELSVHRLSP